MHASAYVTAHIRAQSKLRAGILDGSQSQGRLSFRSIGLPPRPVLNPCVCACVCAKRARNLVMFPADIRPSFGSFGLRSVSMARAFGTCYCQVDARARRFTFPNRLTMLTCPLARE